MHWRSIGNLFKPRRKRAQRRNSTPDTLGGSGYPKPYDGSRPTIDDDFLKQCKRLTPHTLRAYRMNETTVIKTGEAVRLCEAAAMQMVAEKTSIPVPKVLDAWIPENDDDNVAIVMEYIEGEHLDEAWPTLSEEEQNQIVAQLRGYLDELRRIKGTQISSADGSACHERFITEYDPETDAHIINGPYSTETDFLEAVAQEVGPPYGFFWYQMLGEWVRTLHSEEGLVLTHNTLDPRHILVREGKVVAILDWGRAGYYPDYWEYCGSWIWPRWDTPWAEERIPDRIVRVRPQAMAILKWVYDAKS